MVLVVLSVLVVRSFFLPVVPVVLLVLVVLAFVILCYTTSTMFKKFFSLLLASALVFSTASVARAQTPPPNQWWADSPRQQQEKLQQGADTEVNFTRYIYSIVNTVMGAIGNSPVVPTGGSAFNGLGQAIALMTGNPPVQTRDYLAYMGTKAGFINQAYAQDGGFGVLDPVREIWVATRNVAYLITSLTLVVIGFMIMMRKKLDAQTVIGIQQALPSIVITLLLITFSYAIAGLMIDLMYFVLYFIVQLLGNNIFEAGDTKTAIDFVTRNSVFTVVLGGLFGAGGVNAQDAADAIAELINSVFSSGGVLGGVAAGLGGLVSGTGVGQLIISGALLFAMVKLFFSLLTSYAMFIISVIFGPLMLMTNAIPGSNAFGTWIKNLAGNAAVFPATAIFIILAAALMGGANPNFAIKSGVGFGGSASGAPAWVPPLLFGFSAGGATTSPVDALMAMIGLGMLMLTPQFVEMVKKAFQASGGEGYGSAIGQALQYGASGRYAPTGLGMGLGGAAWRLGPGYGLERGQAARGLQLERSMRGLPEFTSGRGGELERAMQQRYGKGFSRLLGWAGRAFGK